MAEPLTTPRVRPEEQLAIEEERISEKFAQEEAEVPGCSDKVIAEIFFLGIGWYWRTWKVAGWF